MQKFDNLFLDSLIREAVSSVRKRVSFNIHTHPNDPIQRMFSALEPGTYVRPHKHSRPPKRELFILIRGRAAVIEYNETGAISDRVVLDISSGCFSAEIAPDIYHHILSLRSGTVVCELKDGPYDPATDKIFAPWAPPEYSDECNTFLQTILSETGLH